MIAFPHDSMNTPPHNLDDIKVEGALSLVHEVSAQPFEYKLLKGHRRTDGSVKTGDQLRTEYMQRSDELIRQITEGVEVIDQTTHELTKQIPDDIVFLDKSARPLAWMVRNMWDEFAPAPGQLPPPKPDMYFVNIDREQWINDVDPEGVGEVNVHNLGPGIIRSLRSIYVEPKYKALNEDGTGGLGPNIDEAPADLDGKTVLIVDEVNSTGRTLKIAENMYHKAFPTASIATTHWMGGVTARDGAIGNVDLPVWYKDDTVYGRGIGDRNPGYAENSDNITQKLGGWFLGTPLSKVEIAAPIDEDPGATSLVIDPLSIRLREEIKQLSRDPTVLKLPSNQREDFDDRAVELNDMPVDDVIAWKRTQDRQAELMQHPSSRRRRR